MRGNTLGDALRVGGDNFLPLRHLAALLVLYGHSYRLSDAYPQRADLVERFLPGFYAGTLAVYVFFAISGYLVTLGLLRRPGFWRYLRNRILRVYPGYLACLLLVALVLGPAFSTLAATDYLRSPQTWQYIATNLSPVTLAWELPGVFADNPYSRVVNGTLWSLGLEVRWYAYLGLLALLGVVSRRWLFTVVALAFLAFAGWEASQGKPDPLGFRALSMVFIAGALLAQWRDRVRIGHAGMAALLAASALAHGGTWFFPLAVATIAYASYWLATALPRLPWPGQRDYSYGLFLYGFPVQQALLASVPTLAPMQLFALATPLALALAALSWHGIESPLLRLKRERGESAPGARVGP